MVKSFEYWLNISESKNNESIDGQLNSFGGVIPPKDKWQTLKSDEYQNVVNTAIPFGDRLFIVNDKEFFLNNIGKQIRFKYDSTELYPIIQQPKLMAVSENIESINEGTWSLPDTNNKVEKLKELIYNLENDENFKYDHKYIYSSLGNDSLFDIIDGLIDKKLDNKELNSHIAIEIKNYIKRLIDNYSKNPNHYSIEISPETVDLLKSINESNNTQSIEYRVNYEKLVDGEYEPDNETFTNKEKAIGFALDNKEFVQYEQTLSNGKTIFGTVDEITKELIPYEKYKHLLNTNESNNSNYELGKNWADGEYKGFVKGYEFYSDDIDSGFKMTSGYKNIGNLKAIAIVKNGEAVVYTKGGATFSSDKAQELYKKEFGNIHKDPNFAKYKEQLQ